MVDIYHAEKWLGKIMSTTFMDTEANNGFSMYYTEAKKF